MLAAAPGAPTRCGPRALTPFLVSRRAVYITLELPWDGCQLAGGQPGSTPARVWWVGALVGQAGGCAASPMWQRGIKWPSNSKQGNEGDPPARAARCDAAASAPPPVSTPGTGPALHCVLALRVPAYFVYFCLTSQLAVAHHCTPTALRPPPSCEWPARGLPHPAAKQLGPAALAASAARAGSGIQRGPRCAARARAAVAGGAAAASPTRASPRRRHGLHRVIPGEGPRAHGGV